jgi:uncharacterized protein (TIGR02145 family)
MDIDGNIYTEVKIGNQVWMVENLKVTRYNEGTPVLFADDNGTWGSSTIPAYCWYKNDSTTYKNNYGALYNWYVVSSENSKRIAPIGWHVPSIDEWDTLQNYLISNGYNWDGTKTENKIAKSIASKTNWNVSVDEGAAGCNLGTNNRSGFSALPTGYRNYDGQFFCLGEYGSWWPSNAFDESTAWYFYIYYTDPYMVRYYNDKRFGYSVRCIRD